MHVGPAGVQRGHAQKAQQDAHCAERLREHRGRRRARDARMQSEHKQQVKRDIRQGGEEQKQERREGIAHAAQHGGEKIVQEDEGNTREDDAQIRGDVGHNLRRDTHEQQERGQRDIGQHRQQQRNQRDHHERVDHGGLHAVGPALAVELAEHHAAAHAQPQQQAGEQHHQRKRAAHGGQRDVAEEPADDPGVHDVVQLLQQIAGDQRQAEENQPAADGALRQIPLHRQVLLYILTFFILEKLLLTARSEEGSLRDEIPQAGFRAAALTFSARYYSRFSEAWKGESD